MTSRSEYNETLGYLNSLLTELTANSGGAPRRVLSYMASHSPLSRV
jgi:hypothetical protein